MAKNANPGELRTPVYFKAVRRLTDSDGYPVELIENVFGADSNGNAIPVMVKWVNAHGSEVFDALQLSLRDPATITLRYSPLINETLIVYRGSDPAPYEVISIDNVENRNTWLEIKVQRRISAK